MLADIRICIMERMETMRKRHVKWHDLLCPTVRKKFEKVKELHRFWHVIPSGDIKFEVRHGSISFAVDERSRTCGCRLWQLSGIPCEHAIAVIYYLNINLDNYISERYKKKVEVFSLS
ncbi:pentatricopeptide repeat-containing protein [Tanacetum coccineum]|uniref:Pentatricopeptide repeat-containing protein n=1 Tax=Tanacetum coccineum TaxID=301880 RepID=A0ABQ4ZYF7_9ASTR